MFGLVEDTYKAWCLDEACLTFGREVEDVVQDAYDKGKGKPAQKRGRADNAMRKMLGMQPKFRSIGELAEPRKRDDESSPERPGFFDG